MTVLSLGYTGSRDGMTRAQMISVYWHISHLLLIHDNDPGELTFNAHHGDCTGGDAEFHVIATVLGCHTVAHPPLNTVRRAWCKADEIRVPKDYLSRDWDLVNETHGLAAAPKSAAPDPHSGTWTTIKYALQLGRPVTVILPDGTTRPGSDFTLALAGAGS